VTFEGERLRWNVYDVDQMPQMEGDRLGSASMTVKRLLSKGPSYQYPVRHGENSELNTKLKANKCSISFIAKPTTTMDTSMSRSVDVSGFGTSDDDEKVDEETVDDTDDGGLPDLTKMSDEDQARILKIQSVQRGRVGRRRVAEIREQKKSAATSAETDAGDTPVVKDVDGDGIVDFSDEVLAAGVGDVDGDGDVDKDDLAAATEAKSADDALPALSSFNEADVIKIQSMQRAKRDRQRVEALRKEKLAAGSVVDSKPIQLEVTVTCSNLIGQWTPGGADALVTLMRLDGASGLWQHVGSTELQS
jgi:hypothetical protein